MKVAVFGAAGWLGRAFLANADGTHQLRACDIGPQAWDAWSEVDGEWSGGEKVFGDIVDYEAVDQALEGMDAVVHMILYTPSPVLQKHRRRAWRPLERLYPIALPLPSRSPLLIQLR